MSARSYRDFLAGKVVMAGAAGFEVDDAEIHLSLKPVQRAAVRWAVLGGRRALFKAFGLGKTRDQLEILRLILTRVGGRALIVAPLGVRHEFRREAESMGYGITFIRSIEEAGETGLYLTNYETVRDGKLDPRLFDACSLDEAAILRGFGSSKTFREFMRLFEGVRFKFVATATPSPNEYIEILAYSAFLEVMDVGQAKTRFFKRNSEKADSLTIHPHKQREFWLWVASWALFVAKPSDLGFDDAGYALPPLDVRWHEVPADYSHAGHEVNGQGRMLPRAAIGVQDVARIKRESLAPRVAKLIEIRAEAPEEHRIIWHDLEAERAAIERAIPGVVSIYGSQDLDRREEAVIAFSDGLVPELAAKPSIAGSGCNFQRHCAWEVFLGIGFKFHDFIQAVHRTYRFGQTKPVRIDIIYSEAEQDVRRRLERRWRQHNEMVAKMGEIIREFGLSEIAMAQALQRSMGVQRVEVSGETYRLVNNDSVEEVRSMAPDCVDLLVTSIPFSTQYEYSPNYADFGHTDDNAHFWQQMDFLTPELLRVTRPGRNAVIHVKDRIQPGGLTGLGFQTVEPFSDECVAHFRRHGWAFLGRRVVVTDVVRENNQTYRLGWTEQCKDGTRMGPGMSEYLLIFRKPPTDRSDGYADSPVRKSKPLVLGEDGAPAPWRDKGLNIPGTGYSRARWQFDAHALWRSSGDRMLRPEDLDGLTHKEMYRAFRRFSLAQVYDFEHHVRIAEHVEEKGRLPVTFMLFPPQSHDPDVWTDVARMRTMNGLQAAQGREMHLCPLQFDIVDRVIAQMSEPGETVFDPFAGLGTVPYCAVKQGRRGVGVELSPAYFVESFRYLEAAAREMATPSLFDLLGLRERDQVADEDRVPADLEAAE